MKKWLLVLPILTVLVGCATLQRISYYPGGGGGQPRISPLAHSRPTRIYGPARLYDEDASNYISLAGTNLDSNVALTLTQRDGDYLDAMLSDGDGNLTFQPHMSIPLLCPTNISCTATTGVLSADTYTYYVCSLDDALNTSGASSGTNIVAGASTGVLVDWDEAHGALQYRVYRLASGDTNYYYSTVTDSEWHDDGSVTNTTASLPSTHTGWLVKFNTNGTHHVLGTLSLGDTTPVTNYTLQVDGDAYFEDNIYSSGYGIFGRGIYSQSTYPAIFLNDTSTDADDFRFSTNADYLYLDQYGGAWTNILTYTGGTWSLQNGSTTNWLIGANTITKGNGDMTLKLSSGGAYYLKDSSDTALMSSAADGTITFGTASTDHLATGAGEDIGITSLESDTAVHIVGDAQFWDSGYAGTLDADTLSDTRTWYLPDQSGTIALTSDISAADKISEGDSEVEVVDPSSGYVEIVVDGNQTVVVTNQMVAIGHDAPENDLHIKDPNSGTTILQLEAGTGGGPDAALLLDLTGDTNWYVAADADLVQQLYINTTLDSVGSPFQIRRDSTVYIGDGGGAGEMDGVGDLHIEDELEVEGNAYIEGGSTLYLNDDSHIYWENDTYGDWFTENYYGMLRFYAEDGNNDYGLAIASAALTYISRTNTAANVSITANSGGSSDEDASFYMAAAGHTGLKITLDSATSNTYFSVNANTNTNMIFNTNGWVRIGDETQTADYVSGVGDLFIEGLMEVQGTGGTGAVFQTGNIYLDDGANAKIYMRESDVQGEYGILDIAALSTDQTYTFPDQTGTVALMENLVSASSNVYYVAASGGNDSNSGLTMGDAWATLEYADGQVSAGDTIIAMSGTHTISGATGVTLPEGVDLRGFGTTTIIDDDGGAYTLLCVSGTNTVSDLVLTPETVGITYASGDTDICDVHIRNVLIKGTATDGLNPYYWTDSTIVGCRVETDYDVFYPNSTTNLTVMSSEFVSLEASSAWAAGIRMGGQNDNLRLIGCSVYMDTSQDMSGSANLYGVWVPSEDEVHLIGCDVYSHTTAATDTAYGLLVASGSADVTVVGGTYTGTATAGTDYDIAQSAGTLLVQGAEYDLDNTTGTILTPDGYIANTTPTLTLDDTGQGYEGVLAVDSGISDDRTWTFPDKDGTVAMTSDVGGDNFLDGGAADSTYLPAQNIDGGNAT